MKTMKTSVKAQRIAAYEQEKSWYSNPLFKNLLQKEDMDSGWYGFDLDGTLAEYFSWVGPGKIGNPIQAMVDILKRYIADGHRVKIFTARVYPVIHVSLTGAATHMPQEEGLAKAKIEVIAIREWCVKVLGYPLEATCVKDSKAILIYDDKAVWVKPNTGIINLVNPVSGA